MKRFLLYSMLALGLVAAGPSGGSTLAAQELPRPKLLRAEDILDREVEAVGGQKAYQKIKTIVTKVKVTRPDMQITHVMYHAGPNKHYELSSDGLRNKEIVVNGDIAWERDSITGARFLKGEEKAQAFRAAEEVGKEFRRVGNWRKEYKKVRTLAEENVGGKPAYKVQMITQKGETVISYYDKQSGLLVRQEKEVESPQGKERVIEIHSDHRKVRGIVMPFKVRLVQGTDEVHLAIEQLEYNVVIPEKAFTLPAELKKLQKKR